MSKVYILKGLPASGKSTWANEFIAASGGKVKRINKDDLRIMVDAGKWSRDREKTIIHLRNTLMMELVSGGFDVIIDDTNFAPEHERDIRALLENTGAEIEINFFDTPLDECIARDAKRGEKSVGAGVIRDMYARYLMPPYEAPVRVEGLPNAIICDVDGTLAHMRGRSPFEWGRVGEDVIDAAVAGLLHTIKGSQIVLVSGREDVCRAETEKWLQENGIVWDKLLMRKADDHRKDFVVKKEIYDAEIAGKYNVLFVLDDRDQVVRMWRGLGLKCLQVAEGNF